MAATARSGGISGVAVTLAGLGAWLVYSGIRDVDPVTGLRDVLQGQRPPSRSAGGATIDPTAGLSPGRTVGRAGGPGGEVGPPTGKLVTVPGTSIIVDLSILPAVSGVVMAGRAAGHHLDGSGYRSHQAQIALRRQHCGTSQYDIYDKPSGQCSPPTARPGHSMHEQGLAVDFTTGAGRIVQRGSPADAWLMANAPSYGLRNLPSEAWHYSTTGT